MEQQRRGSTGVGLPVYEVARGSIVLCYSCTKPTNVQDNRINRSGGDTGEEGGQDQARGSLR